MGRRGVKTVTLPKNLLLSSGTLFEGFETLGDWTTNSAGSQAANTTEGEFREGTQSIKLTTSSGGIQSATKVINWDSGGAAPNRLRLYFYCHNAAPTDYLYIRVIISNSTNIAGINFYASKTNPAIQPGWNVWDVYPENWVVGNGSPAWDTMLCLRMQVAAMPEKVAAVSFDSIYLNPVMAPAIMMQFDDGYNSVYSVAYAYMQSKGVRGTFNINTELIDGVAGTVTSEQLLEMDAAGWDIGNHSDDASVLTGLTQEQVATKLAACKATLDGLGLTRASMHHVYPNSAFNETVRLGAIDAGMLTARGTTSTASCIPDQNYMWPSSMDLTSGVTLAAAQTAVDLAVSSGRIVCVLGHRFAASAGASTWAIADFQALLDYAVSKNLPFLTTTDYYAAQSGPITV